MPQSGPTRAMNNPSPKCLIATQIFYFVHIYTRSILGKGCLSSMQMEALTLDYGSKKMRKISYSFDGCNP